MWYQYCHLFLHKYCVHETLTIFLAGCHMMSNYQPITLLLRNQCLAVKYTQHCGYPVCVREVLLAICRYFVANQKRNLEIYLNLSGFREDTSNCNPNIFYKTLSQMVKKMNYLVVFQCIMNTNVIFILIVNLYCCCIESLFS